MDSATLPRAVNSLAALSLRPVPAPLLPPLLARPAIYLWLWTLPIAVLLAINGYAYWLISGNMDAPQRHLALVLGLVGLGNAATGVVMYAWGRVRQRRDPASVHRVHGLGAIAVQVAYLWTATALASDVVPRSVEAWIYPSDRFLFNQYAFAMLPLFLGILQVACAQPRGGLGRSLQVSAALAIGAPIGLYLLFASFAHATVGTFGAIFMATAIVSAGIAMFIGIVRGLMVGLRFAQGFGQTPLRIAVVAIALVLPLAGLALNRSIPFPVDFQAWEVYALALANASILLFAAWRRAAVPWLRLTLLCAALPFTLYFFVVLLPYTPLSVVAVIFFGLGFLALTPTLLFVLHVHLLHQAVRTLREQGGRIRTMIATAIAAVAVLPAVFTARALADKAALTAALEYATAPKVGTAPLRFTGNRVELRRALASHRAYKNGIYYPFLSDFYSWIVFDNLVLPDSTLAQLETIFMGAKGAAVDLDPVRIRPGTFSRRSSVRSYTLPRPVATLPNATIDGIDVRGTAIGRNAVVTLAMTLRNAGLTQAEFRTTLPLPAGVFVNGFRLEVNGTLTSGRVVEKKTAQWVYATIRDAQRRDPGLLTYAKGDGLELRVFPIEPGKSTRVEIDFLAPTAPDLATASFAGQDASEVMRWLGRQARPQVAIAQDDAYLALGATARNLPVAARGSYLHLIVDRSDANAFEGELSFVLGILRAKFPSADRVRVTLANYDVIDLVPVLTPISALGRETAKEIAAKLPQRGGFVPDLAIAHALRLHRDFDLDGAALGGRPPPRPVVVILSGSLSAQPMNLPTSDAWANVSAGFEVYQIDRSGRLVLQHGAEPSATAIVRRGRSVRPVPPDSSVVFNATEDAPVEYWSDAGQRWLLLPDIVYQPATALWARAAALQAETQHHAENPGGKRTTAANLVAASRALGVVTPLTSYIVVESSGQWKMLDVAERQKLGQSAALEFQEAPSPSALAVGIAFAGYLALRARRKHRHRSHRPVVLARDASGSAAPR